MTDQPVRDAQAKVISALLIVVADNRYKLDNPFVNASVSSEHLIWMLEQALNRNNQVPVDKTGRWIGFVQGVLAARGLLDTTNERDATRAWFHTAYAATGQAIPPTIDRT